MPFRHVAALPELPSVKILFATSLKFLAAFTHYLSK
nr:MAG TPA: hypothetical protein [Caudoviricetes sp.]